MIWTMPCSVLAAPTTSGACRRVRGQSGCRRYGRRIPRCSWRRGPRRLSVSGALARRPSPGARSRALPPLPGVPLPVQPPLPGAPLPFPRPFADARLPSRPPSSPLPAAWQAPPSAPQARPVMPRIRNRPIPIARDHPARLPDIYFAPTKKGFALLTIHYGDMDGVIYNTSVFFNNVYSAEWLEDPFAQKIIKAVDRGVVLGPNAIETKVLGVIPPEKTLKRHKDFASHAFHAREHLQRLQLRR